MLAVLYEDQRGPRGQFGFHRFICQCVLDRSPGLAKNVCQAEKLVRPIVCKGNGNVFGKCKKDLKKLANQFRRVIAVYDQDKLNDLLSLKGTPCRSTLREKLAEPCDPKEALEIVFIKTNLESVLDTIRNSGHADSIDSATFHKALRKDLNARDSLFIQCACLPNEARDDLLALLPDVTRLVSKIVEHGQVVK
jgi:hypothetical protein